MESVFDEVQNALAEGVDIEDALLQEKIEILIQYYESEQWKIDYSADERGELPVDLKRGVLSEDVVYNLLNDIDSLKRKAGKMMITFGSRMQEKSIRNTA